MVKDVSVDADARRDLAVRSAVCVAERFGIGTLSPQIVKDSNNTIVRLNDELVAKVATTTLHGRQGSLDRELAILQHLDSRAAPVVHLSNSVPSAIHEALGCRMIVLDRLDVIAGELDADTAVRTLSETHAALDGFDVDELPSFLDGLVQATAIFADPTLSPTMTDHERRFCQQIAEQVRNGFAERSWDDIVVHGDPWIGGNLVNTTDGPRLLDFEAACLGPREWDLSSLGDLADAASGIDNELLDQCRSLRSYTIAAWCWAQPGRSPEVEEAGQWHLQLLHRRYC